MRPVIAVLLILLTAESSVAQKKPELGYVFPPVVRAGTTTNVQLGGYDFTPDMQFFVHNDRVKLTTLGPPGKFLIPKPPYWFGPKGGTTAFPIAREIPARISVPANTPPGTIFWQVANANGASQTAVFFVSDQSEIIEQRDRDQPQSLKSLPIGVSGRLSKIAEEDRYRFTATKNGPITVELFARRLGADFHGMLEVRDESGRMVADVADTEGLDAALTFAAKAGRSYVVKLNDVDFRGNPTYVYRLAITPGPRVVTTIPAFGRRGDRTEVEFLGYGLSTGQMRWESVKRKVSFPGTADRTDHRFQLKTAQGVAPAYRIPISELTEVTPADKKNELSIPGAITARMPSTAMTDWKFAAKKGDDLRIMCQSRSIGTRLDLSLSIRDESGKQLAANDDMTGTVDAGVSFKVPSDGIYTCRVTDMSGGAGNADSIYRLAINRPPPSFTVSAPQAIHVPLTGKATLTVSAVRLGGFQGEIDLTIHDLPSDMTVTGPLKISAGKTSARITIEHTKNASSNAAIVRITAKAMISGKSVSKPLTALAKGSLCPRDPNADRTDAILLATTMKPPFSLELVDKNRQRAVHRGTTYPAEFLIKRDADFAGDVLLQMASRQGRHRQGINAPIITAGPKVDRILFPCYMPEWLETDRTTRMVVLGVAKVRDPKGKVRYLTKPANARITMILEGALLKVSHQAKELTVRSGKPFTIPVAISRSAKLRLPVQIKVVVPSEIRHLVVCKPTMLSAMQTNAILQLETRRGPRLRGRWTLQVFATALRDGKWPVVSQTQLTVEFQ